MTTIKASCPCCGDIDLTPPQVRLVVCSVPVWSYYTFVCTTCRDLVRKPAAPEIVKLLRTGGVIAETWEVPAEALEEHAGPRISYDDVLDFALWLDNADLVAAAASVTLHGNQARTGQSERTRS